MKRILVATDFSTRSDRALRRAVLLAHQASAEIILVHVVDDDQPLRLQKISEWESLVLLNELSGTVRKIDGIACEACVTLGEPFLAIADIAERTDADVVVMGPYRRQALRNIFLGTTVERTIRYSRRPVIMANAVPVGLYDSILVATDFSECSATAVRVARALGFFDRVKTAAFHGFDAPDQNIMRRSVMSMDEINKYIAEEERRASGELNVFLQATGLKPNHSHVQVIQASVAEMIQGYASKHKSDLVVMGSHGRTGLEKLFLGSVAEEVLRNSEIDVLVVPTINAPAISSS